MIRSLKFTRAHSCITNGSVNRILVDKSRIGKRMLKSTPTLQNALGSNFTTHNAGVHYACYRLSCLCWKITPIRQDRHQIHRIQRRNKEFDVQIRSLTKVAPVPFPQGLDILDYVDYLIICNNLQGQPNLIVMKPQAAREVIHKDTKNETAYWLQPEHYNRHKLNFELEFGEE